MEQIGYFIDENEYGAFPFPFPNKVALEKPEYEGLANLFYYAAGKGYGTEASY